MKSIWRIEYLVGLSKRQYVFNTFLGNRWKAVNREICTVSVNRTAKNRSMVRPTTHRKFNLVGPRDNKSNIRKIIYAKTRDEKLTEKIFRERQQELDMWHQTFWEKQNEQFYQSKKAFLKVRGRDIGIETKKDFADDLSKFYKNFLDGHYQVHSQYLRVWYLRNFQLLWMALQVSTTRFFNKVIPWRSRWY